jgi:hypothetical protein
MRSAARSTDSRKLAINWAVGAPTPYPADRKGDACPPTLGDEWVGRRGQLERGLVKRPRKESYPRSLYSERRDLMVQGRTMVLKIEHW